MANTTDKVITIAKKYIGYIEKASNSNLDSFTANRGTNNYTRFSRDVNNAGLMGCQGQPWCGTSQFAFEMEAFGLAQALKNWHMTAKTYVGYNCFETYNVFKKAGKTSKIPKLGSLVIFTFSHMGRVVGIDAKSNTFKTVEGNTSSNTYDRNGGMVASKTYSINDPKIKGFCIIDYEDVDKTKNDTAPTEKIGSIQKGQKWLNKYYPEQLGLYCGGLLAEDNQYGAKTRKACVAIWKDVVNRKYGASLNPKNSNFLDSCKKAAKKAEIKFASSGTLVLIAQLILSAKGFYTGTMDAEFGSTMEIAVATFQQLERLKCDGVIGPDTWFALFN